MPDLLYIAEPSIRFGNDQDAEDPRDGLALFGPNEGFSAFELQAGVVGTAEGIRLYTDFVRVLSSALVSPSVARPTFPGFEAVFGVKWPSTSAITCVLDEGRLAKCIETPNLLQRVHDTVAVFLDAMLDVRKHRETQVHIWFVIVPRELWSRCRPLSPTTGQLLSKSQRQRRSAGEKFLFDELEEDYGLALEISESSPSFHDQLKARVLAERLDVPIQIIVEPTLRLESKDNGRPFSADMRAHLGWTQSTSLYYKLGKLPWRLTGIRPGVCYVGMVFKKMRSKGQPSFACCAAQLFLDSGDGTVFRGNNGPWYSEELMEFHLDKETARDLMSRVLDSYLRSHGGAPTEVFVHGRARLNDQEWAGFTEAIQAVNRSTLATGIVIRESAGLKLYRDVADGDSRYGVLRGTVYVVDRHLAYLWTRGFSPRLATSTSLEVPNPLELRVTHGSAAIETIAKDVLSLTKVNYNACVIGDGVPVTLRFSDSVGRVLTALPRLDNVLMPFKYYI